MRYKKWKPFRLSLRGFRGYNYFIVITINAILWVAQFGIVMAVIAFMWTAEKLARLVIAGHQRMLDKPAGADECETGDIAAPISRSPGAAWEVADLPGERTLSDFPSPSDREEGRVELRPAELMDAHGSAVLEVHALAASAGVNETRIRQH